MLKPSPEGSLVSMPPKKSSKRKEEKEAIEQSKRQKAWQSYSRSQSEQNIAAAVKDNVALAKEVETFINSKVWSAPKATSKKKSKRFCRGKPTHAKIGPTYCIEVFKDWDKTVHESVMWRLQKMCHMFFPRFLEAITHIPSGENIKQTMDRRVNVYTAILKDMNEFFGDIAHLLWVMVLNKLIKDENNLQEKQDPMYPWGEDCGYYQRLYDAPEGAEESTLIDKKYVVQAPEPNSVVTAVRHLTGLVVLA